MGLFTDFYNTVAKFFHPQDEQIDGDASKSVATNRLKLVLMQDRTNLTPKVLEQMRGELVDLLSKYLEMDKDLLELNFEQEGDQVALMLSIPVIRAKDEDEIEKALNAAISETEEESEALESDGEEVVEEDEPEEESNSETECDSQTEDSDSKNKTKKVTKPIEETQTENADSDNSEIEGVHN